MTFWVYILECGDGSLYVGSTNNLELRFWQHQSGLGPDWTRKRMPVRLIFAQEMPTRDDALNREHQIKRWSRAKKLALANGDWAALNQAARGSPKRH